MLKLCETEDSEDLYEQYQNQRNKGVVEIRRMSREEAFRKKRRKLASVVGSVEEYQNALSGSPQKLEERKEEQVGSSSATEECSLKNKGVQTNGQKGNCCDIVADQRFRDQILEFAKQKFELQMLEDLVQCLSSQNILVVTYGAMGLRRIVSGQAAPPIQQFIDAGVVSKIIPLLQNDEYPQIQMELTWCLTNIAAGTTDQCHTIIQHGAIPILVGLIDRCKPIVVEQALWTLGNMASDSSVFRDMIIGSQGIEIIMSMLIKLNPGEQFITQSCWCLANLCRGNPLPEFERVKPGLTMICVMLSMDSIKSTETYSDCLWAVSYHVDGLKRRTDFVTDVNLIEKIVPHALKANKYEIVIPTLRIIGQLSTGAAEITLPLINSEQVLQFIDDCLTSDKKILRRQACWVLSNFTAGNIQHINKILFRERTVTQLLDMFVNDSEDVRKEICYVFSNVVYGGRTLEIDRILIALGVIKGYLLILQSDEDSFVIDGLDTLSHILRAGEQCKRRLKRSQNLVVAQLYQLNGIPILQHLQYSENQQIYFKVQHILQHYFQIADPTQYQSKFYQKKSDIIVSSYSDSGINSSSSSDPE